MGIDCSCRVSKNVLSNIQCILGHCCMSQQKKLMPHFHISFKSWLDNLNLDLNIFLFKYMLWWLEKHSFQTA